tara:strand:- start:881 stop:4726 length:3846 start_codon:yes stop_codon:yes gene_type:complete
MAETLTDQELDQLIALGMMEPSDDEVLARSTFSPATFSPEVDPLEIKKAEASAKKFGIGQPIITEEQRAAAKERFDAPDPMADEIEKYMDRSKALSMVRNIPLAGGLLESIATRDPKLTAEIEAEDAAVQEEQLQKKYGPEGEGLVRMDPELGLVLEKRDPETGEPRVYPQSEEGMEQQELKERIEDVQEKTTGFLDPYALLQSEETAGVPEGTIDYVGGAYGTAQAGLAALSFDPSPLSYVADMASAGLYKLEGDDEAAADVLRWSLYGAGAGAAVAQGLKARRVMNARKGMIDQFVDAGKSAEEAADMADDLILEAQRVQRSMDEQAAAKKVDTSEEVTEEAAEEIELPAGVMPSGMWTSGLISSASTMPKKVNIDQFLRFNPDTNAYQGSFTKSMGVTPAEIRATGLDEYLQDLKLEGRRDVTREEILKYLNQNRIDFDVIQRGRPTGREGKRYYELKTAQEESWSAVEWPLKEYFKKHHSKGIDANRVDARAHTFMHNVQADGGERFIKSIDEDEYARGRTSDSKPFHQYSGRGDKEYDFNRWHAISIPKASGEKALNDKMFEYFSGKSAKDFEDLPGTLPDDVELNPMDRWLSRNPDGTKRQEWHKSKEYQAMNRDLLRGDLLDEVAKVRDHYRNIRKREMAKHDAAGSIPYDRMEQWLLKNDPDIKQLALAYDRSQSDAVLSELSDLINVKTDAIVNHYRDEIARANRFASSVNERLSTPLKRLEHKILSLPDMISNPSGYRADKKKTEELLKVKHWNERDLRYAEGAPDSPEMMDLEFEELQRIATDIGVASVAIEKNAIYANLYAYLSKKKDALELTRSDRWKTWKSVAKEFSEFAETTKIAPPKFPSVSLERGANNTYREALVQLDSKSLRINEDPFLKNYGIDEEFVKSRFDTPDAWEDATKQERFDAARPFFVERYGENFPKDRNDYFSWKSFHKNNIYTNKSGDYSTRSHWDENNIFVHLRMTDQYVWDDGMGEYRKILLVEEVQSDPNQKARLWAANRKKRDDPILGDVSDDAGYQGSGYRPTERDLKRAFLSENKARLKAKDAENEVFKFMSSNGLDLKDKDYVDLDHGIFAAKKDTAYGPIVGYRNPKINDFYQNLSSADKKRFDNLVEVSDSRNLLHGKMNGLVNELMQPVEKVPNMPFKKSPEWTQVGVKEAARIAVDEGYDGIAFIGGVMGKHTSHMGREASAVHYGKIVPKAFQKATGRKLRPISLVRKTLKEPVPMTSYIAEIRGHEVAADLRESPFMGIMFDNEFRSMFAKPQPFLGKPK